MSRLPSTYRTAKVGQKIQGSVLLEALVSIVIFSFGILGLIGMQLAAIRNSSEAQFRSDAAAFANSVIAEMRVDDPATVVADYSSPSGTKYLAWAARVANDSTGLPSVDVTGSVNLPTISVTASGDFTITLFWQGKSDNATRQHLVKGQL